MTWILHTTPADCSTSHCGSSAASKPFDWGAQWTHHRVLARFFRQNKSQHAADLPEHRLRFLRLWTPIFGCTGSTQRPRDFIAVCLHSPSDDIFPLEKLYLHLALLSGSKGRLFLGVCWLSRIAAASNFVGFLDLIKPTAGAVSLQVVLQSELLGAAATS